MREKIKNYKTILILLSLYFLLSISFLDTFPFMHSDESWLSGLTRVMIHTGLNSTETFFDLVPRFPHAIKSLFHLMQMLFITMFSYDLFSVRLLSLVFAIAFLFVFYKLLTDVLNNKVYAVVSTFIIAFDIQFIYASHFARQEIIIGFGMILSLYYLQHFINNWSIKNDLILGLTIGVFIGVHPNAFLIAVVMGSLYLYYLFVEQKLKFKNLLLLVLTVLILALIFVGISYHFDSQFINHYLNYGDDLGVKLSLIEKIKNIIPFYQKLYLGISATYFTPWIQFQLLLFAFSIIISINYAYKDKKILKFTLPIVFLNLGYIFIGRYSQPSILFMFILSYELVFYLISKLKKFVLILLSILCLSTLGSSILQISHKMNNEYSNYIQEIQTIIPSDANVLANLNTEFAFDYNHLFDVRNLDYLSVNNLSFEDYILKNNIEYIVYAEEMDFIYQSRPVWNIVYGNLYPYYEDMQEFISNDCDFVYEFSSSYAMRIVEYTDDKEWLVKIYRVVK